MELFATIFQVFMMLVTMVMGVGVSVLVWLIVRMMWEN